MQKTKKAVALLLAFAAMLTSLWAFAAPASAAYDGRYRGTDFTDNAELAKKLDSVFYGKVQLFKKVYGTDGKLIPDAKKSFSVGESYDPKLKYYWTDWNWGGSCLAYAQAVFYYLFGEPDANPTRAHLTKSFCALEKKDKLTYTDFKNAKIGVGAYVRTTENQDYTYNGGRGHSLIILSYDNEYLTFLEGNARYNGEVEIQHMTWDDFNQKRMVNQNNRRLCFIVQPNATKGQVKKVGDKTGAAVPPTTVPPTTVPPTTMPPVTKPYVDVDKTALEDVRKGIVNASVARLALRVAVNLNKLEKNSADYKKLDVTKDGAVKADDARMLLRIAVGLE